MKKIISLLLVFALAFCNFGQTVLADDGVQSFTSVGNEYEMVEGLKAKSEKELKAMGYEDGEIEKLKKFDYKNELKKRAKFDDIRLKSMGYTNEQIKALRDFGGTEAEMTLLGATVTLSGSLSNFYYYTSQNKSSAWLSCSWKWSSEPLFLGNDVVAIGWSEGMYPDISASKGYVNYKDYLENGDTVDNSWTKSIPITVEAPTGACSIKFKMRDFGGYAGIETGWAKSGSAFVKVSKIGKINELSFVVKYGHSTLSLSPSIQYSTVPLSISFVGNIYTQASAYEHKYVIMQK